TYSLTITPPQPTLTLFPYTTLFRSFTTGVFGCRPRLVRDRLDPHGITNTATHPPIRSLVFGKLAGTNQSPPAFWKAKRYTPLERRTEKRHSSLCRSMRMGFQFVKSPAIDGGDVPASRAERRRMTSPLLRTSAILAGAGWSPSLDKVSCPAKSLVEVQKARIDRKK